MMPVRLEPTASRAENSTTGLPFKLLIKRVDLYFLQKPCCNIQLNLVVGGSAVAQW